MAKQRNRNRNPDLSGMAQQLKNDIIEFAAITGLQFFQDSFVNEGFTDVNFEAWQKRANDIDPGRAILTSGGALLESLMILNRTDSSIEFGSESDYAEIHNNGGTVTIPITEKSRKYFWYMHQKTGKEYFKWMALTKKEKFTVVIPKRQFVGESETLNVSIDDFAKEIINERFKKL